MREAARIFDVRVVQFVLKIEKLSRIMGPRGSQDLRSPSPIMALGKGKINRVTLLKSLLFTELHEVHVMTQNLTDLATNFEMTHHIFI